MCAFLLAVVAPLHAQSPVTIAVNGNINSRGSMTLWIDSYSKVIRYGEFSNAGSLAAGFGGTISLDANAPVWARGFPDGTIQMVLRYGNVSNIHVDITPDGGSGQGGGSISPPITISTNPGSVGGGTLPTGTTLYSYSITAANGSSGYDPVGNITAYSDSANARWTASYDNLYRLTGAVQSSSTKQFSTSWGKATQQFLCWRYDSFGNRLQQVSSSSPFADGQNCVPVVGAAYDVAALSINSHNQITNLNFTYDASGNLTGDGIYSYQYDGAGRLCAVRKNVTGMMAGYLYDVSGRRVAKGTLNPQTGNWCDMATNGFTLTSRNVVGLDGQTLTEFDSAGTSHSNIALTGGVEATLTAEPNTQTVTHFQFTDWLGTRRLQTDVLGSPEEICSNSAFGDASNCTGEAATVRHFTGQERDSETEHVVGKNDGLDYFGARHYSSALGRWMSPDIVNVTEERMMNPSSMLNKYAYAANNPLKYIDPDGRDVTYFYDPGLPAGHAVLFAYNQQTQDSAIESFGPVKTRPWAAGQSNFDMSTKMFPDAQSLRDNFASITIQTTPEVAQDVINFIRDHPDPSTWKFFGPNCSSQVQKILKRFNLNQSSSFLAGKTPKLLWSSLLSQYNPAMSAFGVPPKQGRDDGAPRYSLGANGFDMYDLFSTTIEGLGMQGTVTTQQGAGWVNCGGSTGTPCPQ